MKNIVWFFSYSSNMNSERLMGRGVKFISKEPAYLENYLLKFNKKSVDGTTKANIIPAPEQRVYGVLYKMNAVELNKLDNIEGVTSGHYSRKTVPVCTINGEVFMADVFIANEKYICEDSAMRPSQQHLNTLVNAASDNRLDPQYIEYLRSLAADKT